MVVEIVATNSAVSHGDQMAMKGPDDGDQVAAVLNLVGIFRRFSFGFVGPIGDGLWT